jgi:Tol biopolymer transport system component
VAAPDGRSLLRLTDTGGNSWGPVWSPDSRTIAYYSWIQPAVGESTKVMLMNADGSNQRQLLIDGATSGVLRVFDWK